MRNLITAIFALVLVAPGLATSGPIDQATALAPYSRYFKVRVAAARLLTGRADAASRANLWRLAEDGHPMVRMAALRGLLQLGGAEGRLARRRVAVDPDPLLRAQLLR